MYRNAGGAERRVDEAGELLAVGRLVALVVEFDRGDDLEAGRLAQDEVEVLGGDPVQGGVWLGGAREAAVDRDHVRQPDLADDAVRLPDRLLEDTEERPFGRREQGPLWAVGSADGRSATTPARRAAQDEGDECGNRYEHEHDDRDSSDLSCVDRVAVLLPILLPPMCLLLRPWNAPSV